MLDMFKCKFSLVEWLIILRLVNRIPGFFKMVCMVLILIILLIFNNIVGEFVIGRVIKAMNANWHPACFRCEECNVELADAGFIKHAGRALCHGCNARIKADGLQNYMCHKCQLVS